MGAAPGPAVPRDAQDPPVRARPRPERAGLGIARVAVVPEILVHRRPVLAQMMREADIVVSCTNTTERMIRPEFLRPSAVVCDVARPSNVSELVATGRRDVMVVDGAVVASAASVVLMVDANALTSVLPVTDASIALAMAKAAAPA